MLPSLIDRLGDAKDSVREQDQTLLLKIMDQAASPQVGPARRSVASWRVCIPLTSVGSLRIERLYFF